MARTMGPTTRELQSRPRAALRGNVRRPRRVAPGPIHRNRPRLRSRLALPEAPAPVLEGPRHSRRLRPGSPATRPGIPRLAPTADDLGRCEHREAGLDEAPPGPSGRRRGEHDGAPLAAARGAAPAVPGPRASHPPRWRVPEW